MSLSAPFHSCTFELVYTLPRTINREVRNFGRYSVTYEDTAGLLTAGLEDAPGVPVTLCLSGKICNVIYSVQHSDGTILKLLVLRLSGLGPVLVSTSNLEPTALTLKSRYRVFDSESGTSLTCDVRGQGRHRGPVANSP